MNRAQEWNKDLHSDDAVRVGRVVARSERDDEAYALLCGAFRALGGSPKRRAYFPLLAERPDPRFEALLWEVLLAPADQTPGPLDRDAAFDALAARRGLPRLEVPRARPDPHALVWSPRFLRALATLEDRRVVPLLRRTFATHEEEFSDAARVALAQTLGQLGGDEAVGALLALLDDGTKAVIEAVQNAFGKIGAPAADALLSFVDTDEGGPAHAAALRTLVALGEPRVVPLLVRRASAWPSLAIELLVALGEPGVRAMAAPPYLDLLLQDEAAERLAARGEQHRGLLLDLLASAEGEGQVLVLKALARLGGAGLGALLGRVLADPTGAAAARSVAALELGQLEDPAALPSLRAALHDRSEEVQASAAAALGLLGDRASISALSELARVAPLEVRLNAIGALGELAEPNDKSTHALLASLLGDPHPQVRKAAAEAVAHLDAGSVR